MRCVQCCLVSIAYVIVAMTKQNTNAMLTVRLQKSKEGLQIMKSQNNEWTQSLFIYFTHWLHVTIDDFSALAKSDHAVG